MKTFAIGVDFGGTNIRVALVEKRLRPRLSARVVAKVGGVTNDVHSPKRFISAMKQFMDHLLKEAGVSKSRVMGIGMGMPGSVDVGKGVVHFLPNVPHWKNVPLKRRIQRLLRLRTEVNNDGNSMAQGEFLFGAARGARNAVFLTLGTGIGGGLLINGALHHGRNFSACEIAHLHYRDNGIRCGCGSIGCIETEIGNKYLMNLVKAALDRGEKTVLREWVERAPGGKLKLEMIDEAALAGDAYAIKFWRDRGRILGHFLAGICNLLNPEVIVIGGGISGAGRLIFDPLKESLKQNCFPTAFRDTQIRRALFGSDAGLIGAASLIFASRER